MKQITNNPAIAGQLASRRKYFGPRLLFGNYYRYITAAVHTRFDQVVWFVWDNTKLDNFGQATIIRQAGNYKDAIAGIK